MVRAVQRACLAAVAALALVGTAGSQEQPPLRGAVLERSFPSKALRDRLSFEIYLPPGYARSGARYPVIYFLHGLPASPYAFRSMRAFEAALDRTGGRAILVVPQGARDGDSDPEYLDWGSGRNWETAIGSELPRYVDGHFRSVADRRGRALVGLSAGGYGAVILALHHLDSYSVMESWSGYFHPTNPSGTAALDLGSAAANRRARARTASSARCGARSGAGPRSSRSTSAAVTPGSAPRTSASTASSPRRGCRTSSSSTAAATSRHSGGATP